MKPDRISFTCPKCDKRISAPVDRAGTIATCPGCKERVHIPEAAGSAGASVQPSVYSSSSHQNAGTSEAEQSTASADHGNRANTTAQLPQGEQFAAARLAFLILPLYAISLMFFLPYLWNENSKVATGRLIFGVGLVLVGVAYRSLQCSFWLSSDPFKAFAIGRYLFAIYVVITSLQDLGNWPQAKVEGPLDGISQQNISYGFTYQNTFVITKPNEFSTFEPGPFDYLGFLASWSIEVAEKIAILMFLMTGYRILRGDRAEYVWDNFCHDVSFGKFGKVYPAAAR